VFRIYQGCLQTQLLPTLGLPSRYITVKRVKETSLQQCELGSNGRILCQLCWTFLFPYHRDRLFVQLRTLPSATVTGRRRSSVRCVTRRNLSTASFSPTQSSNFNLCLFFLQCWENCELLQSNFPVWGAMCSERGICVSTAPNDLQ